LQIRFTFFELNGIKRHPISMENSAITGPKMGRPRAFDEEAALDAAMCVFWEKGYEGTSLDDLTEAMQINRSSLYSTFVDKENLFRRVIERYQAGPLSYIHQALHQPTARAAVENLLRSTVRFLNDASHPRGCLSLQGGMACGTGNEEVNQAMLDWRNQGLLFIQKRMQRAKAEGDLAKDVDPKDLARLVVILLNGLSVQAVNGATVAEMNRAVELAIKSLPL
jgi:AcrR family transcriptional regulator